MPMEIEQQVGQLPPPRVRWPRHMGLGYVRWPRHMGLGAVPVNPQKVVQGVRIAIRAESNHRISGEEFAVAVLPLLKAQGLQVVGEPRLVVDDSPVWVWRKLMQDPSMPGVKPGDFAWMAVVGSGPLKGHEGTVMAPFECTQKYNPETGEELDWKCKTGTPTVKETAALPKFVQDWSVRARPADLELAQSKIMALKAGMREVRAQLRGLVGENCMVGSKVTAVEVPAPKPKKETAAKVGSAAIIGIALAMLTWGRRV